MRLDIELLGMLDSPTDLAQFSREPLADDIIATRQRAVSVDCIKSCGFIKRNVRREDYYLPAQKSKSLFERRGAPRSGKSSYIHIISRRCTNKMFRAYIQLSQYALSAYCILRVVHRARTVRRETRQRITADYVSVFQHE